MRKEYDFTESRENLYVSQPNTDGSHMPHAISPGKIAASLTELWSPRVVGEVDDAYVKVAKVQGTLAWHSHDAEDELFLVLAGRLRIEMEAGDVELGPGEMFVVPKGIEHKPYAEGEVKMLLIEPRGVPNTGGAGGERTAPNDVWI